MKLRIFVRTWTAIVRTVAAPVCSSFWQPQSRLHCPGRPARYSGREGIRPSTRGLIREITHAHRRPDYSKPPPWLLEWNTRVSQAYKMLLFLGATSESNMKVAMTLADTKKRKSGNTLFQGLQLADQIRDDT